jgi:archaemetzincin
MQKITLISINKIEPSILTALVEAVEIEFQFPVELVKKQEDLNEFYHPTRRQYDGSQLLKFVDSLKPTKSIKSIGLFNVDIYIPILTYIFGQAYLDGGTGIASLYRLKNEHYGLKSNDELLLTRFEKVVIHELGHTFGLKHCYIPNCVMRSGVYVEDLDQKSTGFCPSCKENMNL